MKLHPLSFGMGDRFARQGIAQLRAIIAARDAGVDLVPVWNKSNREHTLIGTRPDDVRAEADAAVRALGWSGAYHVDADHIGLRTVDAFLDASDFYTIDVAEFTGKPAAAADIDALVKRMASFPAALAIPGVDRPVSLDADTVRAAAGKFLLAVQEAGRIHRHIESRKGAGRFIVEVSVDETDTPQTPAELFLILAMIAAEGIPAQTIAPKFTGRFNKGVDYVGDLARFEQEFDEDLAVIAFAVREFGLPANLKLSVHSGSDKFSLYPIIRRLIRKHGAGLHVKTAGTTWLEELAALAECGADGLAIAREVYAQACAHRDTLSAPYASVIDVHPDRLPDPAAVSGWDGATFAATLRHDPSTPHYNADFRQLIHVAFKVAAAMGPRFTDALEANAAFIGRHVTDNLWSRHLRPLFA